MLKIKNFIKLCIKFIFHFFISVITAVNSLLLTLCFIQFLLEIRTWECEHQPGSEANTYYIILRSCLSIIVILCIFDNYLDWKGIKLQNNFSKLIYLKKIMCLFLSIEGNICHLCLNARRFHSSRGEYQLARIGITSEKE